MREIRFFNFASCEPLTYDNSHKHHQQLPAIIEIVGTDVQSLEIQHLS